MSGGELLFDHRGVLMLDRLVRVAVRAARADGIAPQGETAALVAAVAAAAEVAEVAVHARRGSAEVPGGAGRGSSGGVDDMTCADLAKRWSCTARNVRDLAHRGALEGRRTGQGWRFPLETVLAFEAGREGAA